MEWAGNTSIENFDSHGLTLYDYGRTMNEMLTILHLKTFHGSLKI